MTIQPFIRPAMVFALASTLLGGCAETHRGYEAVTHVGSSAPSVDADRTGAIPAARTDVKTVRPRGALPATTIAPSDADVSEAEPTTAPAVVGSAVPSPRQIFDFHPAGSAPGSFRQPFVIDMSDGPLTADVRQTAAELKAYNEHLKAGVPIAGRKPCSETDVALKKTGCTPPGQKGAAIQ